jgi:hypothetical protein
MTMLPLSQASKKRTNEPETRARAVLNRNPNPTTEHYPGGTETVVMVCGERYPLPPVDVGSLLVWFQSEERHGLKTTKKASSQTWRERQARQEENGVWWSWDGLRG